VFLLDFSLVIANRLVLQLFEVGVEERKPWQAIPRLQIKLWKDHHEIILHQSFELLVVVLGDDGAFSRQVQLMLINDALADILDFHVLVL